MRLFLTSFVDELEKLATKLIDFPEHEHEAIRHRLAQHGSIYTTRIESERGKYRPGEMVVTPWREMLRVVEVKAHGNIKSHPFLDDLTESEKRTIGTKPFDHVKLEKTAARIKPINYRPVESSNLASVGYDAKRKVLDVKFLGSGTYRYSNVPPKVYRNLLRAKSKGKAFHRLVRKADFDYEKIAFVVGPSSVHGQGILANHPIHQGQVIGPALKRVASTGNADKDLERTELGRYVNHSQKPNASLRQSKRDFDLVALRTIRPGEEILVNYQEAPFETQKLASRYQRPYDFDKLDQKLHGCPIHSWRAKTGIELVHREPDLNELQRVKRNWDSMSEEMKRKSDQRSLELFGMTNAEHFKKLLPMYEKLSSELLLERVREGGIMPSHVHALAKKKGVGFEDLEALMVKLTGKRELEAMNDQELGRVAGQLERI